MILVLCAQDIASCHMGIVKDGVLLRERSVMTPPDGHLAAIEASLREWGITRENLTGLAVVCGPGSFTASRSSVATANGLAFALCLPLYAFSNPDRLPLSEIIAVLASAAPVSLPVLPEYDKAPHITAPKSKKS